MYLLVADIEGKDVFFDSNGVFMNVGLWYGVQRDTSAPQNISSIAWGSMTEDYSEEEEESPMQLRGSITLHYVPSHVQLLEIADSNLDGTVVTQSLPRCLRELHLRGNCFQGTFDTSYLPDSLVHMDVANNVLSGSFALQNVPETLEVIDVRNNELSGSLDSTALSKKFSELYVSYTSFQGKSTCATLQKISSR